MLRERKNRIVKPSRRHPASEQLTQAGKAHRPNKEGAWVTCGSLATPVRIWRIAVTQSKNHCQRLKLVAKDFENDCVIDCAFQILCSRTAAERNDIVNGAEG